MPDLKTEKLKDGKYLVKTNRGHLITKKLIIAMTPTTEANFIDKIVLIKGICNHIVSTDPAQRTYISQIRMPFVMSQ